VKNCRVYCQNSPIIQRPNGRRYLLLIVEYSMPRFSQLSDWLAWLETLHPTAIDLGLERVYQVAKSLQLLQTPTCDSHSYSGPLNIASLLLFTVAGTNGKGSCVTTIERSLLAQQYAVGSYTSPHLHHYNERIRINGEPVSDALICDAFTAIDRARGDISLTYFEFGTLAALWIFVQQQVPFVVLEVGLGGRLDAVNIVDADIAIITSIDVDHEEWLGSDREKIAIEKLGVTRPSKPVVIAEDNLTQSLIQFSARHNTTQIIAHDFHIKSVSSSVWSWQCTAGAEPILLPMPTLVLNSVVAGLQALYLTQCLPSPAVIASVLPVLQLEGRYQVQLIESRQVIFDVAHNPAAANILANKLVLTQQKTLAVFAVMADKAIADIIQVIRPHVDCWYYAPLKDNSRSASLETIGEVLVGQVAHGFEGIEMAFASALSDSAEHDRIVVFGSFFTVEAIQKHWDLGIGTNKSSKG
jgi:dihydrofolate synthase/folylpolyglutamate synthase